MTKGPVVRPGFCFRRFLFRDASPLRDASPFQGRFPFAGTLCFSGALSFGFPVAASAAVRPAAARFAVFGRLSSAVLRLRRVCALGLSFPFWGVSPASARPFCISALSGRCPAVGALRGLLRCGRLGGFLFPRGFRVGLHARREASGIGIEDKSGQFLDVFQRRAFVFRAECDRRAVVSSSTFRATSFSSSFCRRSRI